MIPHGQHAKRSCGILTLQNPPKFLDLLFGVYGKAKNEGISAHFPPLLHTLVSTLFYSLYAKSGSVSQARILLFINYT